MVVTSVIGVIVLAIFEFALLVALVVSIRCGNNALIVVFASCSALFASANYISVRILSCELANYKRNEMPGQNCHGNSLLLPNHGMLTQG
jgi:uncharacterized protein with PQ loop repeat